MGLVCGDSDIQTRSVSFSRRQTASQFRFVSTVVKGSPCLRRSRVTFLMRPFLFTPGSPTQGTQDSSLCCSGSRSLREALPLPSAPPSKSTFSLESQASHQAAGGWEDRRTQPLEFKHPGGRRIEAPPLSLPSVPFLGEKSPRGSCGEQAASWQLGEKGDREGTAHSILPVLQLGLENPAPSSELSAPQSNLHGRKSTGEEVGFPPSQGQLSAAP